MKPLHTEISAKMAKEHLDAHAAHLCDASHSIAFRGSNWLRDFPQSPGVYCVFEDSSLIYVGETGSLKGRMRDLLETRHHILRRHLGTDKFGSHPAYQPGTSRIRFPEPIETLLTDFMMHHLTITAIPVNLGRKEIEERLLDLKSCKYNIKLRRGKLVDSLES